MLAALFGPICHFPYHVGRAGVWGGHIAIRITSAREGYNLGNKLTPVKVNEPISPMKKARKRKNKKASKELPGALLLRWSIS